MRTLRTLASVRCQAMLAPTMPPPMITTSAVSICVGHCNRLRVARDVMAGDKPAERPPDLSPRRTRSTRRRKIGKILRVAPGNVAEAKAMMRRTGIHRAKAWCFHPWCIIERGRAMPTLSVVQILTASIAPVIVISGVGLLARELSETDPKSAQRRHLSEQLRLTNDRAHLLKRSMLYSSVCIFFVSLTILSLFAEQLLGSQRDFLALPFFALCLVSLVVAMYFSIRDITVSLAALELEVSERMRGELHVP